jgi:succinylglutamate desuccinylase
VTEETAVSAETVLGGEGPLRRIVGRAQGDPAGPTLVCIAGLHGNEPAGIEALQRVFKALGETDPHLRGELIGVAGNLGALARRRRFVDADLNRRWHAEHIRSAAYALESPGECAEDRERHELASELEAIIEAATSVFILDLHTSSGKGIPFAAISDTLPNRQFAKLFPIPILLGLEEHLDGTISEYLTGRGYVALTLEAGQHDAPATVDNAEAAIWIALASAGLLDDGHLRVQESISSLARHASSVPRFLEVRYRHAISSVDRFEMEPGFDSFDVIRRGQLLARDRNGEIRSRWQGRILMPLYQELGDDGFFVTSAFKPIWLHVSALLRYLRADAVAHWLPGVSRHPTQSDTFIVDRRIARWYALEILHLMGFRRKRALGNALLVSRRQHRGDHE